MGGGASKPNQPKEPLPDAAANAKGEDVEEKPPDPTESRSIHWRRAWRGLQSYEWTDEDDEFEEHPEDAACELVAKCLSLNPLEARAGAGFIAGRCLLHLAAERGALKSCLALLEGGAAADVADKYQDTPLHVACKGGRAAVADLLLEFGADPVAQNKHLKTPCQWAEQFGQPDAAEVLRRNGGDPVVDPVLPEEVPLTLAYDLMLSVKQVANYKEAFALFDTDNSGELDTEELGNVIRSIGFQVSEAEVVDMVEESDADRSGALDFLEFLELMARRFGEENPELNEEDLEREHLALKQSLGEFDDDKSGTLSHDEFMTAMMKYGEALTDSQAAEILTNLDVDDAEAMEIDYDRLAEILASK